METTESNLKTKIKDFFTKTSKRIKFDKIIKKNGYKPEINDNGLLTQTPEHIGTRQAEQKTDQKQNQNVLAKPVEAPGKNVQLEKLQDGFNNLVSQLQTINQNLSQQVHHQQQLMERLDKLPQMLESFAPAINNQKDLTEQMINELKAASTKNLQFIESVERIPIETAKQTDSLENINHQLAAAADSDAQMGQSFNKFRHSLENLDQSSVSQTDSIMQMSKTFAASDRYLKYIMSRDKKRMFWLFISSLSVCVVVILILAGITIYLGR